MNFRKRGVEKNKLLEWILKLMRKLGKIIYIWIKYSTFEGLKCLIITKKLKYSRVKLIKNFQDFECDLAPKIKYGFHPSSFMSFFHHKFIKKCRIALKIK
jgi:hypothetical protein